MHLYNAYICIHALHFRYMAPECVRNEDQYTEKVDIYSMAMIYWSFHTYAHIYIYIHTYIHIYIYVHISFILFKIMVMGYASVAYPMTIFPFILFYGVQYVCVCVCVCVCVYVCMYVYIYSCVLVCVCVYVCMYVYIYSCVLVCVCVPRICHRHGNTVPERERERVCPYICIYILHACIYTMHTYAYMHYISGTWRQSAYGTRTSTPRKWTFTPWR